MPMKIFIAGNEQLPYAFEGITSSEEYEITIGALETGDYQCSRDEGVTSLARLKDSNYGDVAVVERKSLSDLYGTLTRGRTRFMAEMERMLVFGYRAIVIEATWEMIISPNDHLKHETKASPKSITASLLAISQRYEVHLFTMPTRESAERMTFRILERWWKDRTPF